MICLCGGGKTAIKMNSGTRVQSVGEDSDASKRIGSFVVLTKAAIKKCTF